MPTRLPLPSAGTAAVAPAFDALWMQTTGADRIRLSRTKRATPLTDKGADERSAVALNVLLRQYVSDPLGAQTISGTVRMVARANESHGTADFRSQLGLRVVSNDGATVRGTLLAPDITGPLASEWAGRLTNRKFPVVYPDGGQALAPVEAQSGDRLVVEVGFRSHNLTNTSRIGTVNFGDPASTGDLPEDEVTTTTLCSWLELSAELDWLHTPAETIFPNLHVQFPRDFETGAVDRVVVLNSTVDAGARRVTCGGDSWTLAPGGVGELTRPTVDVPARMAVE